MRKLIAIGQKELHARLQAKCHNHKNCNYADVSGAGTGTTTHFQFISLPRPQPPHARSWQAICRALKIIQIMQTTGDDGVISQRVIGQLD